jgi:hypothetical protein
VTTPCDALRAALADRYARFDSKKNVSGLRYSFSAERSILIVSAAARSLCVDR